MVDDDEQICSALRNFLSEEGHQTEIASSAEDAFKAVAASTPDLVLMDIRMPGTDGLEALAKLQQIASDVHVVMMTAYGTSRTSIEAMRLGAFDYVMKPFDLGNLKAIIDRALEDLKLSREVESVAPEESNDRELVKLIGQSPPMLEVYKLIGMLAARDIPALLVGERGVGKTLVAETIHFSGQRKDQAFFSLSCRALPEELLAIELFGEQVGGDGLDRQSATRGRLAAHGGTVYLEHIEGLSLHLQSRLLGFLSEGARDQRLQRRRAELGAHLIASTEAELGDLVRRGAFSEKLFDRLRVFTIRLPPLRERREDLSDLTSHFIERCNADLKVGLKGVDPRVEQLFRDYPWPGNVGEMENVILRAAAMARGDVITPGDLGDVLTEGYFAARSGAESALEVGVRRAWRQRLGEKPVGERGSPFHDIVAKAEETLVREALAETSGNQVQAARLLGVTRTTLRAKMQRFDIS